MADVIAAADVDQGLAGFPSRNGLLALVVRQFWLAAHHPPGFGAFPTFAGATTDQFPLKLGEAAQDRQHQPTVRRGGVRPGVPQGLESGSLVGDDTDQIEETWSTGPADRGAPKPRDEEQAPTRPCWIRSRRSRIAKPAAVLIQARTALQGAGLADLLAAGS
jgi:hypothetical protein